MAARPNVAQNSVQLYRTSSALNVGARSALYRFDFDNGHDMQSHWKFERYLASAVLVTLPVGIAFPHPVLDYALAGLLVTHFHMGLDQVVFDYLHYRPKWLYYPAMAVVYLLSIVAFAGLTYFNYTSIGFTGAIRQLWSIEGKKD